MRLLSLLRGSDGRSLSRALAALLFINAVLAGVHGGMQAEAAAANASVTCSVLTDGPAPDAPAPLDDRPCCILGCVSALVSAIQPASPAPTMPSPAFARSEAIPAAAMFANPHRIDPPDGPRGPPVLV